MLKPESSECYGHSYRNLIVLYNIGDTYIIRLYLKKKKSIIHGCSTLIINSINNMIILCDIMYCQISKLFKWYVVYGCSVEI